MPDDLRRQLEGLRATQFRWRAEQDPTLTRLKQALDVECAIQQMDSRALLDFLNTLIEPMIPQGENGRDA